jgi:hypothetical protein
MSGARGVGSGRIQLRLIGHADVRRRGRLIESPRPFIRMEAARECATLPRRMTPGWRRVLDFEAGQRMSMRTEPIRAPKSRLVKETVRQEKMTCMCVQWRVKERLSSAEKVSQLGRDANIPRSAGFLSRWVIC